MNAMSRTFTRKKLFDLVWLEPVRSLAEKFGLSDTGLAKACKKSNIPRPPRGYWAKLKAGKRVVLQGMPARAPGMSNEVVIGANRYWSRPHLSEDEVLQSEPHPPVFEDELEDVHLRVKNLVGKVAVPRAFDKAHRTVRVLLDAEDVRRQEMDKSSYTFSWDKPLFDSPFEQRRLRVLNAICIALEKSGIKPDIRGKEGRDLSVKVYDTTVVFKLDDASHN